MNAKTHLLAIAIDDFQDDSLGPSLFAQRDASGIAKAWEAFGSLSTEGTLLLGEAATKANVLMHLERLRTSIQADDRLILIYIGQCYHRDSQGYLCASDTSLGSILPSGIPIADLYRGIGSSSPGSLVAFVDDRWEAKSIHAIPGDLERGLAVDELDGLHAHSDNLRTFCSASPGQVSQVSGALHRGIWSHALIEALEGSTHRAWDRNGSVTAGLLQKYLFEQVSAVLRVTVSNAPQQSPTLWGSPDGYVIVDRSGRSTIPLADRAGSSIRESCLTGSLRGKVRDLRGYAKPKSPLGAHNDWERNFVEKAGEQDVGAHATEIFELLREHFRYKRKEVSFIHNGATASIHGPDFDVHVTLEQDPEEAEKYVLQTEVRSIRTPAIVDDPRFLAIFTKYCKRVLFELGRTLDIQSTIDDIEEVDQLSECLEYDPECTQFTLRLHDPGIILRATRDRLDFCLDSQGDLQLLVRNTRSVIDRLAGEQIFLGVTE